MARPKPTATRPDSRPGDARRSLPRRNRLRSIPRAALSLSADGAVLPVATHLLLIAVWQPLLFWIAWTLPWDSVLIWWSQVCFRLGLSSHRLSSVTVVESDSGAGLGAVCLGIPAVIAFAMACEGTAAWLGMRLILRRRRLRTRAFTRIFWRATLLLTIVLPAALFLIAPLELLDLPDLAVNLSIYLWPTLYFFVAPAWLARVERQRRARRITLRCPRCQYLLRGIPIAICPECGLSLRRKHGGGVAKI